MTARRVACVAALLLVAAAAPVLAHGGHNRKTMTKEAGPYNVTFITAARVVAGNATVVGWRVVEQVNGTDEAYDEDATATLEFYDADNATISTQDTPANATDQPGGAVLVARLALPSDTRWVDYTLHLPNASVTFGQSVQPPPGAESQGDDETPSTPLGAGVAVAALAIGAAWRIRSSRE